MSDWHQAEQHAQRARQFYESGQWHKALAELRLALNFDPSQSDWHFGMGLTLDALGQFDDAIRCFEEVIRLRGEDGEAMLHLAIDLLRTSRPEQAIETLTRLEKLDPDCEASYCHRVLAYARIGDHDQAETMFYLARQISDECPVCYDHLAHSLFARGDLDRATWCWMQTLRLDPHYPDTHANLARACWRRGQLARAHQFFLEQLREDPGDTDTLIESASLLVEMGRHAEAREKLRRALELNPTLAAAHLHLGELALFAGHHEAATVELEMAGRLEPDLPGVHLALARIVQQRGDPTTAQSQLRAELDLTGHTPDQMLELAHLLIDLRMPQPAVELLSPMILAAHELELDDSRMATALLHRGVARMMIQKIDEGIADCRRALRIAPGNVIAMQNLVLAYLEARRIKRARCWLRRARRLEPNDDYLRLLSYRVFGERVMGCFRRIHRLLHKRIG